ncbi:hypothetical protein BDR04DRAFT_1234017 [Suillus decipiens]|nr:hypothetical protein BDR04DRAFT_1234017 [Suillus decipiens]
MPVEDSSFPMSQLAHTTTTPMVVSSHTLYQLSLSPGLNPSVAVFAAEKKIKWNDISTQVFILTQLEVDNSNMSYYGETGMYLLHAAGNFDRRVTLGKEGPIRDVSWSPNSKEFGVVWMLVIFLDRGGHTHNQRFVLEMPAKITLFDHRMRTFYDFGSSPRNFIFFNQQGRLVALASFGDLAGKMTPRQKIKGLNDGLDSGHRIITSSAGSFLRVGTRRAAHGSERSGRTKRVEHSAEVNTLHRLASFGLALEPRSLGSPPRALRLGFFGFCFIPTSSASNNYPTYVVLVSSGQTLYTKEHRRFF